MGRPLSRRPRRGLSRREFLRRASALSAALGAQPFLAASAQAGDGGRGVNPLEGETSLFQHGVASGDPLATQVMFWTRLTQAGTDAVQVKLEVATDAEFTLIVKSRTTDALPASDYTVKIDQDGLASGTTYYYRFSALGYVSPVGRTRTLPEGSVERLRLAVVSCSSFPHGYFNAYRRIAERADLDAVIHLGDYLYEYADQEYGTVRETEPVNEIVTLEDYRTRHAQYKRDADLQELHRQHPVITIWDDHETSNNSWKDGAENHQPDTEGDWAARVDAALQAYYEWLPIREPSDGNRRNAYRRFEFGDLADLQMLETRLSARDEQVPPNAQSGYPVFTQTGEFADPARQMIGSEQEKWLGAGIYGSPARWHLVGQGVVMAQLKVKGFPNETELSAYLNPDQWDGYNPARQRLFEAVMGAYGTGPIANVVVLAGDIHSSIVADLTPDPNNPDVTEGGYDPQTGEGSIAVEFTTTSVTSPSLEEVPSLAVAVDKFVRRVNPHIKYSEWTRKGYLLLDVTPERVNGEYWYVDTVLEPSSGESFAVAYQTLDGANRVSAGSRSRRKPNPPALAP